MILYTIKLCKIGFKYPLSPFLIEFTVRATKHKIIKKYSLFSIFILNINLHIKYLLHFFP